MKKFIIPAIIAKTQSEFEKNIIKVKDFVEIIQLDFMDNIFVPNSSIDFDFNIPESNCSYEAHLMVSKPEEWIQKNGPKVDTILVHYESCKDVDLIIEKVRKLNKKIGFVLNPETSLEVLSDIIDRIDQVLLMTVNPGFYGSSFLPEIVEKISDLRKMKAKLDIEVDGGITDKTINLVNKAGANMFVSGSYIVKSNSPDKAIEKLKKKII